MRLFSPSRVSSIFICIAVVFCASSRMTAAFDSVRPRMKASGAISISVDLQGALDDARVHQIVERVVDRPQIGIDFFAHVAGQKAEPLAGLDRRPRQHDAIDFLALEQLHGIGHRKPGLAGAGGAGREHQRVALERANIGVLRRGAGADAALAQIDLLEILPRRGGIEIEQRALRQREPDGAVDVALHQFVAALEPLIKALEHAARLIAGFARAFERDLIAARIGDDAEPALDQSEVLAVLSEQRGGEAVVVEGENDLRRIVRCDEDRFFRLGVFAIQAPAPTRAALVRGLLWRFRASAPNRLLLAISVIVTAAISPISDAGRVTCTGCR